MIEIIVFGSRYFLAFIFGLSGISKLQDRQGTEKAVKDFGVPKWGIKPTTILLPLIELLIVGLLVFNKTSFWGGLLSSGLLLIFIVLIANLIRQGKVIDCHCFGQRHRAPTGWNTIYRNLGLLMLSFLVILGNNITLNFQSLLNISTEELFQLLIFALFLFQCFLVAILLDKQAASQKAIEILEDVAFSGLPIGTRAPYFKLANHKEQTVSLHDLLEFKKPVILFFTSPNCPVCNAMMPYAIEWHEQHKDKITLVFMSFKGEKTAPLEEIEDIHFLVPKDGTIPLGLYKTREVPTAVHITPNGKIGSRPANGGQNIEELIHKLVAAA